MKCPKHNKEYAKYILENNMFREYELLGLMGEDELYQPHNIPSKVWREVFNKTSQTWRREGNDLFRLLSKDEPQRFTDYILRHNGIAHTELRRCIPW